MEMLNNLTIGITGQIKDPDSDDVKFVHVRDERARACMVFNILQKGDDVRQSALSVHILGGFVKKDYGEILKQMRRCIGAQEFGKAVMIAMLDNEEEKEHAED